VHERKYFDAFPLGGASWLFPTTESAFDLHQCLRAGTDDHRPTRCLESACTEPKQIPDAPQADKERDHETFDDDDHSDAGHDLRL